MEKFTSITVRQGGYLKGYHQGENNQILVMEYSNGSLINSYQTDQKDALKELKEVVEQKEESV